jgi:hypothetical protein
VSAIKSDSLKYRAHVAMELFNHLVEEGTVAACIYNMPKDMDYINIDPERIADILEIREMPPVKLKFWKPWNPWSKALAMVKSGDYSTLYLNVRKLDRSVASLTGSIAHEWGHCLEFWWKTWVDDEHFFNHGDNRRKPNTFQYQLGERVKAWIEDCEL